MTDSGEPVTAAAEGDRVRAAEGGFVPVPVLELELSAEHPALRPNALGQVVLLVRLHGVPLGTLTLLQPGPADVDLRAVALQSLREEVARHLERDGVGPDGGDRPPAVAVCASVQLPSSTAVTVVVCTIGEDPRLVETVRSVLAQSHRDLELVVVDNRPASGRVAQLLAGTVDPRLRVVAQPRPGLSAARNAGAAAATGSVIAFTDDDAAADPDWVRNLVHPFDEDPAVACTTGLVLPAAISTPAQAWFEEFGAFDKGFERRVWAVGARPELAPLGPRGEGGVLFPYSAGVYGSGNNMAFRTDWLRTQPLFDEALGAGTIARGGEDLDAFLRVMLAGGALVYEPRALVRHHARSDLAALRRQMYGYGSGMAAVVVKHVVSSPRRAVEISARLPAGLRKLLDPQSEKNATKTSAYPSVLVRSELAGYAAGPVLLARSRRQSTRRLREHPGPGPALSRG